MDILYNSVGLFLCLVVKETMYSITKQLRLKAKVNKRKVIVEMIS